MSDITETENTVPRSIRPAEAVKAWERIYQSREVIRAGEAAKVRSLHDWMKVIGPFVHERINKTKAITGTTRGTIYAAELKKQMGAFYPIYKKQSDNGAISFLMNIMDNLQAVEAWLETLPKDERPHHPNRVWPAYQKAQMPIVTFKDEAPDDLFVNDNEDEEADADDEGSGDGTTKRRRRPEGKSSLREEIGEMLAGMTDDLVLRLQDANEKPDEFAESFLRRMVERGHSREAIIDRLMTFGRALIAVAEALQRQADAGDELLDAEPVAASKKRKQKQAA